MSLKAQDVYGILNSKIEEGGSGTGGTTNYNNLQNKPKINNVELTGNKTLEDLGIQEAGNYLTEDNLPDIPEIDETLSISGNAADAKVVGDKFTELDGNIEDINENISGIKNDLANTSDAIISEAEGETILVNDSGEKGLSGLKVFGWSKQDGTPSPDNPVPIVSAGDSGEIGVSVSGGQLLDPELFDPDKELNGITFTKQIDGTIQISGTATGVSTFYLGEYVGGLKLNETYSFFGTVNNAVHSIIIVENGERKYASKFVMNENIISVIPYIQFIEGQTINEIDKPMFVMGETPLPFQPYVTPQTLILSTPGGLPGIPVSSGGNYTDESGQQWICDEIDLARGKYVQRVGTETINGGYNFSETPDIPRRFLQTRVFTNSYKDGGRESICNIALWYRWGVDKDDTVWKFAISQTDCYLTPPTASGITTANELNAFLNSLGFPLVFAGQLATPIETSLSAEQIAAYKALHTYSPTTTVSNDAGAYMEVEYAKDIEKYINDTTNEIVDSVIDNYDAEIKSYVDTNYVKKTDLETDQEKLEKYIESYYSMKRNGKVYQTKLWKFATNPTSDGEKLLSNAGLIFSPSTDTTEGQDDYLNGQHPMFEWVNVNYIRDNDGTARPTAIEGMDNYATSGSVDVGVMQMSFYWKWDTSNAEYDLITVSDSPHPELGLEPWPECIKEDGTILPWCIGSKYISGIASDGLLRSQPGLKPERKQSYNNMITNYQLKGTGYWGAGAVRNLFQIVFNAIKGATKNSQTLYQGVTNWNFQYDASVESETSNTYFPVTNSQAENLIVGNYVSVGYGYDNSGELGKDRSANSLHAYADDVKILSIETLDENNKAVYLDIKTGFNTTPVQVTDSLTSPIIMSSMHTWSGMTDSVIGKHDGSPISNTNSKMPYRVQGREYAVGGYIIASDTVMDLQGDFTKNVYVAEKGTARSSSDSTIRSTYKMVGTIPAAAAGNNADWWIGDIAVDMDTGVWYPSVEGSSSSQGMADRCYAGGSTSTSGTREYLQGGDLGPGLGAGSACLSCWGRLSGASWSCLGCD